VKVTELGLKLRAPRAPSLAESLP